MSSEHKDPEIPDCVQPASADARDAALLRGLLNHFDKFEVRYDKDPDNSPKILILTCKKESVCSNQNTKDSIRATVAGFISYAAKQQERQP